MISENDNPATENRAIVRPEGDVVAAFVPELRSRLLDLVRAGARQLVLDLSNVQMVDSLGLGLLISAHNSLLKVGGKLSVVHASADVLDLFKTMRLHQHFSVSGN
jgi:anti-anti-sigma factor